jgi:hypothetical protein
VSNGGYTYEIATVAPGTRVDDAAMNRILREVDVQLWVVRSGPLDRFPRGIRLSYDRRAGTIQAHLPRFTAFESSAREVGVLLGRLVEARIPGVRRILTGSVDEEQRMDGTPVPAPANNSRAE